MCILCCCIQGEDDEAIHLINHTKAYHVTVVGDKGCGKTCLIYRFTRGQLPRHDTPTVLDTDEVEINRRGRKISLYIHDTSGTEEDARLRNAAYINCNVVIVCFSIDSPESLHNVVTEWATEVRHLVAHAPVLLVGLKKDTRGDRGAKVVTENEGKKTAKAIGAVDYIEYSAFDKKKSVKEAKHIFGRAIQECRKMDDDHEVGGCICC